MKITHEERPPFTILHLEGNLGVQSAPILKSTVNGHLQAGRVHLVLDLAGLDFLDSIGLTTLVGIWTTLHRLQGSLRVCGVRGPVLRVFQLTRVEKAIPLFSDLSAALATPPGNAP